MTSPGVIPLNESEPVVLDSQGNGMVQMRPDGSHERWMPTMAAVSVAPLGPDGIVNEATCSIYSGQTPTAANLIDATLRGSSGNNTDRLAGRIIGRTRDAYVWAVWTGGDPGAVATLTITGTKTLT